VIGDDGKQLGVMALGDALSLARSKGVDLVEIAPNATPPVCRLVDYGKFRYEQSKREREAKKKQHIVDIKEVRMTPKIEDHDLDVKTKQTEKFLKDGDKVKVSIRFRGREIVHAGLSRELMLKLAQDIGEWGSVEREPRVEGRNMIMILTPKQS
jgi:translation initiation factor IF-3